MEKEDIVLLAQLLETMKALANKLEKDFNAKDAESLHKTKAEMVKMQERIRSAL